MPSKKRPRGDEGGEDDDYSFEVEAGEGQVGAGVPCAPSGDPSRKFRNTLRSALSLTYKLSNE